MFYYSFSCILRALYCSSVNATEANIIVNLHIGKINSETTATFAQLYRKFSCIENHKQNLLSRIKYHFCLEASLLTILSNWYTLQTKCNLSQEKRSNDFYRLHSKLIFKDLLNRCVAKKERSKNLVHNFQTIVKLGCKVTWN